MPKRRTPAVPSPAPQKGDTWKDKKWEHEVFVKQDRNDTLYFWKLWGNEANYEWSLERHAWQSDGVPTPNDEWLFVKHDESKLDPDASDSDLPSGEDEDSEDEEEDGFEEADSEDEEEDEDEDEQSESESEPDEEHGEQGTPRTGDVLIYEDQAENGVNEFEVRWDRKKKCYWFDDDGERRTWGVGGMPQWYDEDEFPADAYPYLRKPVAREGKDGDGMQEEQGRIRD